MLGTFFNFAMSGLPGSDRLLERIIMDIRNRVGLLQNGDHFLSFYLDCLMFIISLLYCSLLLFSFLGMGDRH